MKTYDQLTPRQQETAEAKALEVILRAILEGGIRFNDTLNKDDLQARIDRACERAEAMQTPWFSGAYILDTCRPELEGMARADAQDALYPEPGERVLDGVLTTHQEG